MNKKIKGIIFDVDGVITQTASFHFKAWKKILSEFNIKYSKTENSNVKGLSRIDTLAEILKLKKVELSQKDKIYILQKKNDLYKSMLKNDLTQKDILPGIKNFLINAKNNGLKLAIASSSFNAPLILKKLNLEQYFDFIVNPADVKKGKPNKEIFVKGYQGINLKSDEVIGIEDAIEGAKGLHEANVFTVCITRKNDENWDEYCDLILNSTKNLNLK